MGVVSADEIPAETREHVLGDAGRSLLHRGPDGSGAWDSPHFVASHRRLAVIDPTHNSRQPALSPDARFVLVYNGEVYNYSELGVGGHRSDTRALVSSTLPPALDPEQLRGMFAYALWDACQKTLLLVRDRFGMKPLYYHASRNDLYFGSTAHSVASIAGIKRISPPGLSSYLRYGSVQSPWSIFEGVLEVPPGTVLRIETEGGIQIESRQYWAFGGEREGTNCDGLGGSILDTVRAHTVSDVPVALFLSGGVDSAVLAAAASRLGVPITGFTLGFPGMDWDESPRAHRTARHYGLQHKVVEVPQPLGLLGEFIAVSDQPSVDGFNSYIVSSAAASHGFKVALSGAGADEILCGYNLFRRVPATAVANLVLPRPLAAKLYRKFGNPRKAEQLAQADSDLERIYLEYRSVFSDADVHALSGVTIGEATTNAQWRAWASLATCLTEFETAHYLRNTLLRDADVFGMASSVEIRTPFVDHLLLADVLSLSNASRMVRSKHLIGAALGDDYLRRIAKEAKTGFNLPYGEWMRVPLRAQLRAVPEILAPYLASETTARVLSEWSCGNRQVSSAWSLLVLAGWVEANEVMPS